MAGEGSALVAHAVVFVSHPVNSAINVEFLPVIGHLCEIMAEMDEDVAEGLIGSHVLGIVTEPLDGHAGSGPETDLVELNPLDLRAAKEHRAHRAIADRQGFRHPGFCWSVGPQAEFSRHIGLDWRLLRPSTNFCERHKTQCRRCCKGREQEMAMPNASRWNDCFVSYDLFWSGDVEHRSRWSEFRDDGFERERIFAKGSLLNFHD